MAMGPIMAIGGVDMLIPPSAITVLLGSLAGISITGLLVAGVVPGILLSALFVGYIVIRCWLNPALAPAFEQQAVVGWARWRPLLVYVTPLVAIFVIVIVAMSAGWATPTESAALGALATVAVCVAYRSLSWKALLDSLRGTAAISGMILFIVIGATTFSQILSFSGGTNGLVTLVQGSGLSPFGVLLVMMAILLVLGCFIDQVSTMLITLPFYMPLVQHFGFDPLWFGVMYLICMQLGLLTPPFGMLLFTMRSVAPKSITTKQIYAAVTPYVLFGLLMLGAVMAVPGAGHLAAQAAAGQVAQQRYGCCGAGPSWAPVTGSAPPSPSQLLTSSGLVRGLSSRSAQRVLLPRGGPLSECKADGQHGEYLGHHGLLH